MSAYHVTMRPNMTKVRLHILAAAIARHFYPAITPVELRKHINVLVEMATPLMEHAVANAETVTFNVVRNGVLYRFEAAKPKIIVSMN